RLLFAKYAKHDRIIYPRFKTIGARSPTFAPALGLLCFINKYAAIHDEPSSAVVSVERLKIVKNKASYNEYEDEL
ncbi:MAG TPA: hypothetical protein DCX17_02515, partial [Firmicutes bacterium]|nr:hypothetical protein [Bacillota bacterium]